MNRQPIQSDEAWGLEIGGSAIRLVHVRASSEGFLADRCLEAPLDDRWTAAPSLAAAIDRLGAERIHHPLAVCVGDEWVLHRSLLLPAADEAILEKVAASQVEALLPAQTERFRWSWRHDRDPLQAGQERMLLAAARKDAVEQWLHQARRLGCQPSLLLPSAMALGAAWPLLAPALAGQDLLLMDVSARATALCLLVAGKVFRCGLVDHGGDRWTEQAAEESGLPAADIEKAKLQAFAAGAAGRPSAAPIDDPLMACLAGHLAAWAQQLREAYDDCVTGVPRTHRPARCILFGRAARTPDLIETAARTLGLAVEQAATPPRLALGAGVSLVTAAPAIAAAICALTPQAAPINLTTAPREKRTLARALSWRWPAAAAWLVAAMIALYLLDRHEANWLSGAVREAQVATARQGGLSQQLAVGRFLEDQGPTPLAVLDEISALAPPTIMLSAWRCTRAGEVFLAGTAPNDQELQGLLKKLSESPMVRKLEPKIAKMDQGRLKFEIAFRAGGLAATSRPADKTTATSQATQPARPGAAPGGPPLPEGPPKAATPTPAPGGPAGAATLAPPFGEAQGLPRAAKVYRGGVTVEWSRGLDAQDDSAGSTSSAAQPTTQPGGDK